MYIISITFWFYCTGTVANTLCLTNVLTLHPLCVSVAQMAYAGSDGKAQQPHQVPNPGELTKAFANMQLETTASSNEGEFRISNVVVKARVSEIKLDLQQFQKLNPNTKLASYRFPILKFVFDKTTCFLYTTGEISAMIREVTSNQNIHDRLIDCIRRIITPAGVKLGLYGDINCLCVSSVADLKHSGVVSVDLKKLKTSKLADNNSGTYLKAVILHFALATEKIKVVVLEKDLKIGMVGSFSIETAANAWECVIKPFLMPYLKFSV